MVDSHLLAVPESLATIPIGDPAENPRGGVLDPPVARVPPVAATVLETMAESSARDESESRELLLAPSQLVEDRLPCCL
jgi:hypothetical protein